MNFHGDCTRFQLHIVNDYADFWRWGRSKVIAAKTKNKRTYINKSIIIFNTIIICNSLLLFVARKWKKELAIYFLIATALIIVVSTFFPFPFNMPIYFGLLFVAMWRYHKRMGQNKEERLNHLFGSENWWKELVVIILIDTPITLVSALYIPAPYYYIGSIPFLYLIIWKLHKRTKGWDFLHDFWNQVPFMCELFWFWTLRSSFLNKQSTSMLYMNHKILEDSRLFQIVIVYLRIISLQVMSRRLIHLLESNTW